MNLSCGLKINSKNGNGARTFTGRQVDGFTTTKLIRGSATAQVFKPGYTLWLIFNNTGVPGAGTESVLGCAMGNYGVAGKYGWRITRIITTGIFYLLGNQNSQFKALFTPYTGINMIALRWKASDSVPSYSINGGAVTTLTAMTADNDPDSTGVPVIGSTVATSDTALNLTSGGVISYAIWSKEATDTEMKNYTNCATGSRFVFSTSVTGDATCTQDYRTSRDWDGVASTITTLGSSPVTYTVTGAPGYTDISERRVPLINLHYADGKTAVHQAGSTLRNSYSRVNLTTSLTKVGFEVKSTMNEYYGNSFKSGKYCSIGVISNGTFSTDLPSTDYTAQQTFDVTLPAGSNKSIDLVEGPQAYNPFAAGNFYVGTFLNAIRYPVSGTVTINTPSAPTKRLLLIGDSILTAWNTTVPQQKSVTYLKRADATAGVTLRGAGSQSVYTIALDQTTADATAALIAQELDGSSTNDVWIALGTNDYGLALQSAANFQTAYARLVDAIHAAIPGAAIYCQTPVQRLGPNSSETANSFGSTLGNYRTAIGTVVGTRGSFCTLVDGTTILVDARIDTDGVHITDTGASDYKAFIATTLGY